MKTAQRDHWRCQGSRPYSEDSIEMGLVATHCVLARIRWHSFDEMKGTQPFEIPGRCRVTTGLWA